MSGITFYVSGTIDLTNGSAAVVGHSTLWTGLTDGDLLVAPDGNLYELTFTDDTHATLDRNYAGSTVSGSAYTIMRVSTARDSIGDASRKLSGVASTYRGIANFTAADQLLKLSQATIGDKAGLLLQTAGVDKIRVGLMESGNFDIQWLNAGVWTTALRVAENGAVTSTGTIGVGKRAQVRVAATGNLNLASPGGSIDAVSMVIGDWFLAPAQTTEAQNGIYIWNGAAVAATRAPDFATYNSYAGALVAVVAGTVNANTLWFCSANEDGTLGTTDIIFTKLTFPAGVPVGRTITAGAGLTGGGDLTADRTISKIRSTATPLPNGAAAAGTSDTAANEDHVHPRPKHIEVQSDPFPTLIYKPRMLFAPNTLRWLDSAVSFSRSSVESYMDAAGLWRAAASGEPAFHTDYQSGLGGLLVQDSRTNGIRNVDFAGAAVGTPGTLPTNMTVNFQATTLSRQIVALGTIGDLNYMDIRFFGTAAAAQTVSLLFDAASAIPAANGDTWTIALSAALIAGSLSGVSATSPFLLLQPQNSTPANLSNNIGPAMALTNQLNRFEYTLTIVDAATAFIRGSFCFSSVNGANIDFTVRLVAPQLELGSSASTPIRTSGAAATRTATIARWIDPGGVLNNDEGTLYFEGMHLGGAGARVLVSLNDGVSSNRLPILLDSTNAVGFNPVAQGSGQGNLTGPVIAARTRFKAAAAWRSGQYALVVNGGAPVTTAGTTLPVNLSRIDLGNQINSNVAFAVISRVAYWPRHISTSNMQGITAL